MSHDQMHDAPLRDDPQMARLLERLHAEPGPSDATRDALWQRIAADLPASGGGSGAGLGRPQGAGAGRPNGLEPAGGRANGQPGAQTWSGPWLFVGGATVLATIAAIVWLLQAPAAPTADENATAQRTTIARSEPAVAMPPARVAARAVEPALRAVAPPLPQAEEPEPAQAEVPVLAQVEAGNVAAPVAVADAEQAKARPALRPEDALKIEVALLGRARSALDRGSPDAALAALRHHGRRFGDGQLAEEREALEIVALARLGKIGAAQSKAARFLHDHSRSLHSQTVRDAIAGLSP